MKYLARHEYKIGIDFQEGVEKDAYRYRNHSCRYRNHSCRYRNHSCMILLSF